MDIWYHYLVFNDGTVVQTRCIDEIGYHNSKNNLTSLGVALVWDFNKEKPTQAQYDALNILLWVLTDTFTGAEIKPHRSRWSSCPGKYFDKNKITEPINYETTLWKYVLSRYYSPQEWQSNYFHTYIDDVKMNCWLNKDWTAWDCSHTANGTLLTNEMIWKVGACPERLKWKTIQIDMWFGKQDFYCVDVWSAIKGNRLDIWCWYWQVWYDNIKNWVCKNTGIANIYLTK